MALRQRLQSVGLFNVAYRRLQPFFSRPTREELSRRLYGSKFGVPPTSQRYDVHRLERFSRLTAEHVSYLKDVVGESGWIEESSELESYNIDWLRTCRGQSKLALRPKTTEQVSRILSFCNDKNLAICPQGGNTGFVGGSVPVFDEVILSLSRMRQIIGIDHTGLLTAEAGVVLQDLDNFAAEHGRIVPLDLGAKGSCQIGGNVSTNAGGLRLMKYGSLQGNVAGLEVVLADGTILPFGTNLRKDNTGYHLHHLFIGSEGSLGVVTKVAILCPKRPTAIGLCLLGVDSFPKILECFEAATSNLTDIISAFEFMDEECFTMACTHFNIPPPISRFPFYVIIETSGFTADTNMRRVMDLLENLMTSGQSSDGVVSDEPGKMKTIWKIREGIAESQTSNGYVYKYDLSIPKRDMYKLVETMRQRLGDCVKSCGGFGHIGDDNLHLCIIDDDYKKDIHAQIEPFVFDWTRDHGGSVSAEHGLGFEKRNLILHSKDKEAVKRMFALKQLFDPRGILNPYKVLPDQTPV